MSSVTYSPMTAIFHNGSPGTLVTGSPGSGKTYALQNIASNCLLTNQIIIALDGKNDMMALKDVYPDIEIIDINEIEDGGLNPFEVLDNIDSPTLMSIIECMVGGLSRDQNIAVQPIIQDFVKSSKRFGRRVTFSQLAAYLYQSDDKDAQSVGSLLMVNEDSKYGKLIFSDDVTPKENGFKFSNGSQIISLFGLPMPSHPDSSKYTPEERFTSAIIYIITKKLSELLTTKSKIPRILFLDECHILFSNPNLKAIVDSFLVLGRSLNIASILATQNVTHIPEDLSNQLSTKFIFRSDAIQAKEYLKRFNSGNNRNLLNEESIISGIVNATTGECFMIDYKNRGGFLKIQSNLGVTSNPLLKKKKKGAA